MRMSDSTFGNRSPQNGYAPEKYWSLRSMTSHGIDVAEDAIVDGTRVDTGAINERLDAVCTEIGGMHSAQLAATAANRGTDGIDNERFRHGLQDTP